jgi:hypothetical protein
VDARTFERARRRTLLLRSAFAAVTLTLLALAVLAARDLQPPPQDVLPQGRSGVIVLDLSRSIGAGPAKAVRSALERLASPSQRLGLVVFSDTAYELFPPGSPGTELQPVIRFFTRIRAQVTDRSGFLPSPWDDNFRAGTQISNGLWEGMQALRRGHVRHGTVLLVSDLADEPDDVPKLVPLVIAMQRAHIDIKILALNPLPGDRNLFARMVGDQAFVGSPPSLGVGGVLHRLGRRLAEPLPWSLAACALALLLALGANELACGRLELPLAGDAA